MKLVRRLLRRLFQSEISDAYDRGVVDGVNQYHYDRESALWMIEEEWHE